MADLSRQTVKTARALRLDVQPYWRDHHFEGKAVLPAVETLILLARILQDAKPGAPLSCLIGADFARLLDLPAGSRFIDVAVMVEQTEDGWSLVLQTARVPASGVKRTFRHAGVHFMSRTDPAPAPPFADFRKLEGACIQVPSSAVYRELIPFGPAYRNLGGDLAISGQGALAELSGGDSPADERLLGSPFVLDAAMHAACVWGQRYAGIVAFPVGFERRDIYKPTRLGQSYLGRILPLEAQKDELRFDVWIFDSEGVLCERILALRMRDISRGRIKPPRWIQERHD